MDVRTIANEICDQADDFLSGVRKRDEAKAGIAEYLTMHHRALPAPDKQAVIAAAMRILENEGFFEASAGGEGDDENELSGGEEE